MNTGSLITGLLGVAFVVLKLCKIIAWPWIWVLAPFWFTVAFAILVFIIYVIYRSIKS